jgi:DNA-binding response OmpR family regulator
MPQVLVLSVGTDETLLTLRGLVLREAGYFVEEHRDLSRAMKVFKDGDFDLVILCHSIAAKDRQRIASIIKAAKPSTLVIVIRANGEATSVADASVHSMEGADGLLNCIDQLLTRGKPD